MLGGIWSSGHPAYAVGTPFFVLGAYDPISGSFSDTLPAQPIDAGPHVIFSTLHVESGGRHLHIGWFGAGGCLTCPREVTYDALRQKLMALPVDEITALRTNQPLGELGRTAIPAGRSVSLFDGSARSDAAFDIEVELEMPSEQPLAFGAAILAASAKDAEVLLNFSVGLADPVSGERAVNMSALVPFASMKASLNVTHSFTMPDSATFALRALADRAIVEAFAAGGRGVITTGVLSTGKAKDPRKTGVFLWAGLAGGVTVHSAKGWAMGCGWARWP